MRSDDTSSESTHDRQPGLLASLRRLAATTGEILHTRIEILSVELEEAGLRIGQLVVYGLVSLLFLGLGLLLATALVVTLFWETHRIYVLTGFTVVYCVIGISAALVVRYKIKNWPRLFSTTLSELSKDHERLTSRV